MTKAIDPKIILHNYILHQGEQKLHWNFSSKPKNGSHIHRFSIKKLVSTMCTLEICEYQSHP